MQALILAGGLGTRLRGVINDKPKPMVPVAGRPFLEYLILQLRRQDFTDIVLCIGYLGKQVREYFGDGSSWGVKISYSEENEPLGTGGAVKLAKRLIRGEQFLAMNGDSFLDIEFKQLIDYHLKKRALATIALAEVEDATRYGTVEINDQGEIQSFVEKGQSSKSKLINGGIYVFSRKVFDYIPEGKVSLEKEVFPNLIGKGFYGLPVKGFFIDIGMPEDYKRLQANPECLLAALRYRSQAEVDNEIPNGYVLEASSALSALRKKLRWKPGKDIQHLEKRKAMGHLPKHSSLEDYNALINELIGEDSNIVYLYEFGTKRYYAVRGSVRGVD